MLDIVIRAMTAGKVMLMLKARGIMKSAKGSKLGGDSPERDESYSGVGVSVMYRCLLWSAECIRLRFRPSPSHPQKRTI